MLNNFVHQPPERCAIIEGADLPQVSRDQFDQLMRLHYGQPDTWITDGVRAADSAVRRLSFKTHGAVKEKARRCSPIWDWQKKDVMGALKRDGLSLPDEYTWLGRSFDALRYDTLVPLSKHEPEDWERIKQWFPMIEMELMRGAMNGVV
ncbi:hypothetical protein [Rhodococcus sp. IEGM 1330]|uniref:hypothetical protein n=1 Tax=Rhodococcus sp. IEGM 1330 TaxID=3082225 RepID=UPI002953BD77|nr:hypothetical protein [Rhodococcus sp. IEGM 1330]MDV8024956.1 hypothetical protein [Rhodococcus sp. IEGM 1330]